MARLHERCQVWPGMESAAKNPRRAGLAVGGGPVCRLAGTSTNYSLRASAGAFATNNSREISRLGMVGSNHLRLSNRRLRQRSALLAGQACFITFHICDADFLDNGDRRRAAFPAGFKTGKLSTVGHIPGMARAPSRGGQDMPIVSSD